MAMAASASSFPPAPDVLQAGLLSSIAADRRDDPQVLSALSALVALLSGPAAVVAHPQQHGQQGAAQTTVMDVSGISGAPQIGHRPAGTEDSCTMLAKEAQIAKEATPSRYSPY